MDVQRRDFARLYFGDARYHFHICSRQVASFQLLSKRRVLGSCGCDQHRSQSNSEYHLHGNPPPLKIGVKYRLQTDGFLNSSGKVVGALIFSGLSRTAHQSAQAKFFTGENSVAIRKAQEYN